MASTGNRVSYSVREKAREDFLEYQIKRWDEYCKKILASMAPKLPDPWQGYYPFVFPQPGTPDPDPDPPADATPKTLLEVGDRHEHKVSKIIEDMPEVERQMMYKYLYARGVRIDSCNHKIDNELAKEWRAIKNAKS